MITVIFVLNGNIETAPIQVEEFHAPSYSIRNEISEGTAKV